MFYEVKLLECVQPKPDRAEKWKCKDCDDYGVMIDWTWARDLTVYGFTAIETMVRRARPLLRPSALGWAGLGSSPSPAPPLFPSSLRSSRPPPSSPLPSPRSPSSTSAPRTPSLAAR